MECTCVRVVVGALQMLMMMMTKTAATNAVN